MKPLLSFSGLTFVPHENSWIVGIFVLSAMNAATTESICGLVADALNLNVTTCMSVRALGTKAMLTGFDTRSSCPVGVSRPVARSMRKTTMLSDFWCSTSKYPPVGSSLKSRGQSPREGVTSSSVSVPDVAST